MFLREPQHTLGAYPRHPQTPKWKEFLHKLLVGGLGYAPGVCWKVLRMLVSGRVANHGLIANPLTNLQNSRREKKVQKIFPESDSSFGGSTGDSWHSEVFYLDVQLLEVRIKGDGISGLADPNFYPIYKDRWNNPLIRSPLIRSLPSRDIQVCRVNSTIM